MLMKTFRAAAVALLLAIGASCAQQEAPVRDGVPHQLETEQLTIDTANGPVRFTVEIADNDEERNRGLMFRESLADDRGMLFHFQEPEMASFWMRNTVISLDIIFIGDNGRVVSIAAEAEPKSDKLISSVAPVRFVLELNAKKARLMHLKIGDTVRNALIDAVAGRT